MFLNTLYNKPIERLAIVRGAILLRVVLLKDITASNTKASAQHKGNTQHVVLMRKIETPEIEFNPLLLTHEHLCTTSIGSKLEDILYYPSIEAIISLLLIKKVGARLASIECDALNRMSY